MEEIYIKFTVNPKDVEAFAKERFNKSEGWKIDFIDILQWSLYDDSDGAMLEGTFEKTVAH